MNYYQILGVSDSATTEDIVTAYQNKVQETTEELRAELHHAYTFLSDPETRRHYDLTRQLERFKVYPSQLEDTTLENLIELDVHFSQLSTDVWSENERDAKEAFFKQLRTIIQAVYVLLANKGPLANVRPDNTCFSMLKGDRARPAYVVAEEQFFAGLNILDTEEDRRRLFDEHKHALISHYNTDRIGSARDFFLLFDMEKFIDAFITRGVKIDFQLLFHDAIFQDEPSIMVRIVQHLMRTSVGISQLHEFIAFIEQYRSADFIPCKEIINRNLLSGLRDFGATLVSAIDPIFLAAILDISNENITVVTQLFSYFTPQQKNAVFPAVKKRLDDKAFFSDVNNFKILLHLTPEQFQPYSLRIEESLKIHAVQWCQEVVNFQVLQGIASKLHAYQSLFFELIVTNFSLLPKNFHYISALFATFQQPAQNATLFSLFLNYFETDETNPFVFIDSRTDFFSFFWMANKLTDEQVVLLLQKIQGGFLNALCAQAESMLLYSMLHCSDEKWLLMLQAIQTIRSTEEAMLQFPEHFSIENKLQSILSVLTQVNTPLKKAYVEQLSCIRLLFDSCSVAEITALFLMNPIKKLPSEGRQILLFNLGESLAHKSQVNLSKIYSVLFAQLTQDENLDLIRVLYDAHKGYFFRQNYAQKYRFPQIPDGEKYTAAFVKSWLMVVCERETPEIRGGYLLNLLDKNKNGYENSRVVSLGLELYVLERLMLNHAELQRRALLTSLSGSSFDDHLSGIKRASEQFLKAQNKPRAWPYFFAAKVPANYQALLAFHQELVVCVDMKVVKEKVLAAAGAEVDKGEQKDHVLFNHLADLITMIQHDERELKVSAGNFEIEHEETMRRTVK